MGATRRIELRKLHAIDGLLFLHEQDTNLDLLSADQLDFYAQLGVEARSLGWTPDEPEPEDDIVDPEQEPEPEVEPIPVPAESVPLPVERLDHPLYRLPADSLWVRFSEAARAVIITGVALLAGVSMVKVGLFVASLF
jgi:hypothetical protein